MVKRVIRGGPVDELAGMLAAVEAQGLSPYEMTAALIVATRLVIELTARVAKLEKQVAQLSADMNA